jgi:hypothetical protein
LTPATWDRFAAWLDAELRAREIQPGVGYSYTASRGGFSLSIKGGGGSVSSASFPFQILTQSKPGTTTGQMQWGVIYESALFKSFKPDDKQTITGLLSENNPDPYDAGWLDMIAEDAIWLTVVFSSGDPQTITSATVNSWGNDDDFDVTAGPWSGNDGYLEDDGAEEDAKFQTFRKLIGYSYADDDGNPVIVQGLRQNQVIIDICEGGKSAKYPIDHGGGYALP